MKITKVKTKAAEIEFSKTELFALRQVFNEACYGIRIAKFEETIGVSEDEAEHFFDYFNDLEKRTSPGSPIIHKVVSQEPAQNNQVVIRKLCGLKSEKYDFCFYMQKSQYRNVTIRFGITLQKRGTDEIIIRTDVDEVLIERLRKEITLLKEGINSFSQEIDFHTSYSFFNKAVHVNISSTESDNSQSLDKPQLAIEFIFEPREKVDAFDTPALNSSNVTKSFISVTTLDEITRFVADVEDFLKSIIDPVAPGGGTAFKPKSGKKYFDNLR